MELFRDYPKWAKKPSLLDRFCLMFVPLQRHTDVAEMIETDFKLFRGCTYIVAQRPLNKAGSVSLARKFPYVAGVLAAIAFAYFIWPTPWVVTENKVSNGRVRATFVERTNRFTGAKERSTREGWRPIGHR